MTGSSRAEKRRTVKALEEELQKQVHRTDLLLADARGFLEAERALRVAAQQGLLPYVMFVEWLRDHVSQNDPLRKAMRDWWKRRGHDFDAIRVGYRPMRDPNVKAAIKAGKISPDGRVA